MAVTLTRTHTSGTSNNTQTLRAVTTDAVAVGALLVTVLGSTATTDGASAAAILALSKPSGESATWARVASAGDSSARVEVWAIKTTVTWASGTSVVATRGSNGNHTIGLWEFASAEAVVRGQAGSGVTSAATSGALNSGDLAIGSVVGRNLGTTNNGDSDTTGGSWSSPLVVQNQGTGSGVMKSVSQFKILTQPLGQVYDQASGENVGAATVVALRSTNVAPNTPALTTMADGGTVNRGQVNRASHAFSDDNPGDTQSAADHRYRIVGAADWTNVTVASPAQFYDFPANLAAGDYERQVRTYDSLGLVGPWSASGFFSAVDPPPGPTITYPTNGQTVNQDQRIDWSTPSQAAYQVRRVADNAGSPQAETVYFDTGEVASTTTRTLPLTFAINMRAEHVQVRVKNDGLWSPWSSVRVLVLYTQPAKPTHTITPEPSAGSLLITISNPTPSGSQPAVAYNDVLIDDGAGFERKATNVASNSTWRYWTPRSGRDYSASVRVVAVATNNTTSTSDQETP